MNKVPNYVKNCVTHHNACDCREYLQQAKTNRLEARVKELEFDKVETGNKYNSQRIKDCEEINKLETQIEELREILLDVGSISHKSKKLYIGRVNEYIKFV